MTYIIERNREVIVEADSKEHLLDKLDEIYDFTEMQTDEEIVELDGIKMRKSVADEIIAQREEEKRYEFERAFFNTSLGWVSRVVHVAGTGRKEDFLADVLPILEVGVPILTYTYMGEEQNKVLVTEEFINECKQQKLNDFYPIGE